MDKRLFTTSEVGKILGKATRFVIDWTDAVYSLPMCSQLLGLEFKGFSLIMVYSLPPLRWH
jgi:hypothetical protein